MSIIRSHSEKKVRVEYPRKLAVRVLTRVLNQHEPLDEVLAEVSRDLAPAGGAWLQEVCAGTLRWKGRLEFILDSLSVRKKPSGWLRKILLIASYQLIVQDRTPAGPVVSETVSEIKAQEGIAPAKFANACLRRIAEQCTQWRSLPLDPKASTKDGAAWASLPEWLWARILRDHGREWGSAFAEASLQRPTLWIRSQDVAWHPEWTKPGPIPGALEVLDGKSFTERPGFQEGKFLVQDVSGQILVEEITQEVKKAWWSRPLTALDLCAAPGGKSVGMAWSEGFQVVATDRNEARIPLLRQTLERAAPEVEIVKWDEREAGGQKDLIWVDAPCSGTGIVRRHPDVRWLRQEKELTELTRTQTELLRDAWKQVSDGGFLAYSVCSILKEEGPDVIRRAELSGCEVVREWFLCPQTAPHGDGFWATLLRKT